MEELKFRGKCKDKWQYGYYVFTYNCCYIISNEYISIGDEDPSEYFIEVIPETVSQFTGLKSSDGGCGMPVLDAYFGDIIRFYNTDGNELKAEIIWYELEQCIGFKRLTDGFVYNQRIFNDSGYFQPSKIMFEIIGNIHEHPNLIKNGL